eukprot:TRINITY_DN5521_c0_g1_i1.p1 TRINITY_DN5521_c0_g1~~TRINITY_DN5521_c0_g1_i1.p1  ORF type:complete len:140 (-),score=47.95 TRINITY_DN5521_c0_g1_i1:61-459(-)
MSKASTKKTLYVGGLEETVDSRILHAAFIPFGDISDIQIPLDQNTQKHKGFAFIEFEEPADAAAALDNMNNSEIYGRVIKCNMAKPITAIRTKAIWAEDDWHDEDLAKAEEAGAAATAGDEDEEKTAFKPDF